MPYGQGGRLGESINPALMMADYSGFANAGAMLGNSLANVGAQIGDAIKLKQKEKKAYDNQKSYIGEYINQASKYFPEMQEQLQVGLAQMNDPKLNAEQQLGVGKGIMDAINLYGQKKELELQAARIAAAHAGSGKEIAPFDPQAGIDLLRATGAEAQATAIENRLKSAQNQYEYDGTVNILRNMVSDVKPMIPQPEEPASGQLVWKDNKAYSFNPKTNQMAPVVEARPKRTGVAGVVDTIADTLFGQKPVTRKPEVPSAQENLDVKMNAAKNIASLYASGDKAQALQLFTASGFNGAFGGTPTMQDLDEWAASQGVPQSQPSAPSGIFAPK